MHLNNKAAFAALIFLSFCVLLAGNVFARPQSPQSPQNQSVQPTPLPPDIDATDPALPVWMRSAPPSSPAKPSSVPAPGASTNTRPNQPTSPDRVGSVTRGPHDQFGMVVNVQNVTLPVIVVDDKRHLVTDLDKRNFVVYEKGEAQEIIKCTREDVPVSIGILVDNSGSMREKRQKVSTAVLNLIKASNPSDEVFIVNFNDEPYLDQDFTNDLTLMHEALDRLDSRGGTALYDAVVASSDHLAKAARREKKVLLVVTDGEDNESRESLEQAIRAVQDENGPMIYTIGILGSEGRQHRAKRALEALSFQTGGVAFFPKNPDEVDVISQQVARDIRNQYTIVYRPSTPPKPGEFVPIKVEAHASGYRGLTVRTKNGYFAGEQRPAASNR